MSPALIAPVVVVAHNRIEYLTRCITTLLQYWSLDPSHAIKFPLFVSVDGGDPASISFSLALKHFQVIHNVKDVGACGQEGYCHLSLHYKMLLHLFFNCHLAPRVLFLEEDLEIAADFFGMFEATAPLMDRDATILCVSAWNDHGQLGRASNVTALYRTDILPGLGWMLTSAVGRELLLQWPKRHWDDWLRRPEVRKGRQCIFPEVPRTHTFGRHGTSGGLFYTEHLENMILATEAVDWAAQNISYLQHATYSLAISTWISSAVPVNESQLPGLCRTDAKEPSYLDYKVFYNDLDHYLRITKTMSPMISEIRGGAGRASYNGTVIVRCAGHRLFLTPSKSAKPNYAPGLKT